MNLNLLAMTNRLRVMFVEASSHAIQVCGHIKSYIREKRTINVRLVELHLQKLFI